MLVVTFSAKRSEVRKMVKHLLKKGKYRIVERFEYVDEDGTRIRYVVIETRSETWVLPEDLVNEVLESLRKLGRV